MRRIIVKFVLATLVAVAVVGGAWVLVAPSPAARAAFPGHNGRIAFMQQDSDGFLQNWVADADLSNQVKLTSKSANSGYPVWKPGGAKLAFDSDRADPDPSDSEAINDVFKMNPDGSGVVKLTHSQGFSSDPGWSPDGSRIAFASDRGNQPRRQQIFVMDADGSNVRRVSTLPANAEIDLAPRFSPNGKRIVFTRYRGSGSNETAALFTIGVNGGGPRRLTAWDNHAGDADWSPDGTKIVFEAYPSKSPHGEIFKIDADGEHLKNLTHNYGHGGSSDPVWSPDGKKILFVQGRAFDGGFRIGLATMKPDGTARHFISSNPKEMEQPDWESIR